MKKLATSIKTVKVLGIDLAKNSFSLHGVDRCGKTVFRKTCSRKHLPELLQQLPPCLVGMEACGGAHYWGRRVIELGLDVKLMAPQFVKPFVKSQKNDALDAEAICEAVQRPNMRFVPVKSIEQQDILSLHRVRQLVVRQRTSLCNQIRGLLMEYGITIQIGIANVMQALPMLLDASESRITQFLKDILTTLKKGLDQLNDQLQVLTARTEELCRNSEVSQRLKAIPGFGPILSTAFPAAVGKAQAFANGRHCAAWLGLVPRQHSTGGKTRLGRITKNGDRYLRYLLVHGARAVVSQAAGKEDSLSRWIQALVARRGKQKTYVALANKMARIGWALMARDSRYTADLI